MDFVWRQLNPTNFSLGVFYSHAQVPAAIPCNLQDRMQHCQGDTVNSMEQRERGKKREKNPWIITSLHPKAAGEMEMDACRVYEATFAVNPPQQRPATQLRLVL